MYFASGFILENARSIDEPCCDADGVLFVLILSCGVYMIVILWSLFLCTLLDGQVCKMELMLLEIYAKV